MRVNLSAENAVFLLLYSIFPVVCTPFGVVIVSHRYRHAGIQYILLGFDRLIRV